MPGGVELPTSWFLATEPILTKACRSVRNQRRVTELGLSLRSYVFLLSSPTINILSPFRTLSITIL
jgi:hypothetical protein